MEQITKCDCCGKSELLTQVISSSVGAVSFSYCIPCESLGIEPRFLSEEYKSSYYNEETDSYFEHSGAPIDIILSNGMSFKTRGEFVKWGEEHG